MCLRLPLEAMSDPLAYFRTREDADRGRFFLSRFPDLLTVCAAWSPGLVRFQAPEDLAPEEVPTTEDQAWDLMWAGTEIDVDKLVAASGIEPDDYRFYLRRLLALRLIYPDGTVPSFVKDEIQRAAVVSGLPRGLEV